jgi:hypothetical protein
MKPKEFAKLFERDGYCLHCGETEAISPQHRVNRGMGGSKLRDNSSNLMILCSELNFLMESNSYYREMSIEFGWKLESWQDPKEVPVFDGMSGVWYFLDDNFGRKLSPDPKQEREL